MKRFLRVLIPVLLSLAVIISIGWYLFEYDPGFTRDMLVSQARYLDESGNHSMATWFYTLAYRQSGNDEQVALELAEQYRTMGNYTKAEYTLSNAIADGGSVDLYIALCNIYVEQDKLLDAVTMLDNVADPAIRQQLAALRPAAPSPSHEPGYFNQYISVLFTAPQGQIFLTTDGQYPSVSDLESTTPLTLSAGETVIHALTVGQNGLVSPLAVMNYTIAGVIESVTIDDPAMDAAIREKLNVSADHTLYTNELWTITDFTVPAKAKSLDDLSKLCFLQRLSISDLQSCDLTGLTSVVTLEELTVTGVSVTNADLRAIATLPKLQKLTLSQCSLSSISSLTGACALTYLNLSGNTIRDISVLQTMPDLTELYMSHNALVELDALSGLSRLEVLNVAFNSISSAAPLAGCSAMKELNLSNNALTDLTGLDKLTKLEKLYIAFTGTEDVSILEANAAIRELDISNNAITDISAVSVMTKLEYLNFSYNQVKKLPAFSKDVPLITIKGSQNKLSSLKELQGLKSLNYVYMDFNEKLSSVTALEKCPALVEVSVYGTNVHDVGRLKELGVQVTYSPI